MKDESQAQPQAPNEVAEYLRRQPTKNVPEKLRDGSERDAPVTTSDAYPSGPGTSVSGTSDKEADIEPQDTDL